MKQLRQHLSSKRGIVLLFLLILLSSERPVPYARAEENQPQSPEVTATISGIVTDEDGNPLSEIEVQLLTDGSYSYTPVSQTTSDVDGHYEFSYVKTGSYLLHFSNPAKVLPLYYPDATTSAEAQVLFVIGEDLTGLNMTLPLAGAISGQISSAFDAVKSVSFSLYRNGESTSIGGYEVFQRAEGNGTNYTIMPLPAGEYKLKASAPLGDNYFSYEEFYHDALLLEDASLVLVHVGQTTEGINFVIDENPLQGSIHGVALDPEGVPLSNVTVQLYSAPNAAGSWTSISSRTTDDRGTFRFVRLAPGIYTLGYSHPSNQYVGVYYTDAQLLQNATPIAVEAGVDVVATDVRLNWAGKLEGTVYMPSGNRPNHTSAYLFSERDAFQTIVAEASDYYGQFTFTKLEPGRYRLLTTATQADSTYTEFYNGAFSIDAAHDITVTAAATGTKLEIYLGKSSAYGAIQGQVLYANDPVNGIEVTPYLRVNDLWQATDTVETDGAGMYQATLLRPGRYRLCFADPSIFFNEKCTESIEPDGNTPIELSSGQTLTIMPNRLAEAGSISGTLTFMADIYQNDVKVTIYQTTLHGWEPVNTVEIQREKQNRLPYIVGGLDSGIYRVHVAVSSYSSDIFQRYYPGVQTIERAADISVTFGATTSNIDLVIGEDNNNAEISGNITVQNSPAKGIEVILYKERYCCNDWSEWITAATDVEGNYHIAGLPADDYRLAFVDSSGANETIYYGAEPPYEGDKPSIRDAKTIKLDADDVTTVNIDISTRSSSQLNQIFLPIIAR